MAKYFITLKTSCYYKAIIEAESEEEAKQKSENFNLDEYFMEESAPDGEWVELLEGNYGWELPELA